MLLVELVLLVRTSGETTEAPFGATAATTTSCHKQRPVPLRNRVGKERPCRWERGEAEEPPPSPTTKRNSNSNVGSNNGTRNENSSRTKKRHEKREWIRWSSASKRRFDERIEYPSWRQNSPVIRRSSSSNQTNPLRHRHRRQ